MTQNDSCPPLLILLAGDDRNRAHVAFSFGLAALALGRAVTFFAGGKSVRLFGKLRPECDRISCPEAEGVLCLDKLIEEAIGLGANLIACETGLLQTDLKPADMMEGVKIGGLVGFIAQAGKENITIF